MNYVAYLILRRLRAPLISLIVIYSVAILGYVLIPGQDGEGNPTDMSFFHAIYFVSFMASTIGFGEVPHEFTDAQRFWTLFSMYATVIGWLYSIGAVFAIFRDEAFIRLLRRTRFRHQVEGLKEPFYLVCGYGLTGSAVVESLADQGRQCVVVDIDPERIEALELDNLPFDVPAVCHDASDPEVLRDAGIEHPLCTGVICLTNIDTVNLAVAIASKLLAPKRPVIARVETQDYARNLASFGTDHIIDPFEIFADYLNMAIHHPYRHLIYDSLISPHLSVAVANIREKQGNWVICGYGRFGKALKRQFDRHEDFTTTVIEPNPEVHGIPADGRFVKGLGTEASTLLEAQIKNAVGIVAGSDDDANNLSMIMTARELKPRLITVARQNKRTNRSVFAAAKVDMIMEPSTIMANHISALLKSPLLVDFLREIRSIDEGWCRALFEEILKLRGDRELENWSFDLTEVAAPAFYQLLRKGVSLPVGLLYKHPQDRNRHMACKVLLVRRDDRLCLTPPDDFELRIGDQVLLCGLSKAAYWMQWSLKNENVLRYIRADTQAGSFWGRWFRRTVN